MNETQEYMAILGDLVRELNRARDIELQRYKDKIRAETEYTDAMVKRHNAQIAYNEHLCKRPGREPGDQLI